MEDIVKKFSVQSVGPKTTEPSGLPYEPEGRNIKIRKLSCDGGVSLDEDEGHLGLYESKYSNTIPGNTFLHKISTYTGGIEPTADETKMLKQKQTLQKPRQKLGTFLGVFLPCIQNIFGVLIFVRMAWIAGVAGGLQSFLIVGFCCSCTIITTLSMSAIATNGKVPAGGSYFLISRSIGPEFGGAVGILFYLGTSIAAAMYLVGTVEVFLKYIFPGALILSDDLERAYLVSNRVYGTVLALLVMCCVLIGIRFVSKFAVLSLVAVLFSILCMYIGIFVASPSRSPLVCSVGERLISRSLIMVNGTMRCDNSTTGPLYALFCGTGDKSSAACIYFTKSIVSEFPALPGLGSNKFFENFMSSFYRKEGASYDNLSFPPELRYGQGSTVADITTSFTILLAIYFPSVTGIMAGSNRSGDLANPEISIPLGTMLAVLVSSFVYLSSTLLFTAVADGRVLRDKFGECMGGEMLVAALGWPHYWVIRIGTALASVGASLQSLTGAPRLLQAIAKDEVIPFLSVFKTVTKRGEPLRAQILTYAITQSAILIASIDHITPLITMFFLLCYMFVNLATALNGFLKEPSWRPRFRYHHWFLSIIGVGICLTLMFISSWYYAIAAVALAGGIYKYIEYKGASKEWGDATRGLQFTAAMRAILALGTKPIHTKNWRPQLLVYLPVEDNLEIRETAILHLVRQLKAGKGLTLIASILEGDIFARKDDVPKLKVRLEDLISHHKVRGLSTVFVANTVGEGMKNMAQCAGLGNLRHNTILISYPDNWREAGDSNESKMLQFTSILRTAQACKLAVMVPRFIATFPDSKGRPMFGTVDVWFIVHDGGILLLTAYLLMKSRVWSKCRLRIFVVTSDNDDTKQLAKTMNRFLYDLRIAAEVRVVVISHEDISAYANQRTVGAQERKAMLKELNINTMQARSDMQAVLDEHYVSARGSRTSETAYLPKLPSQQRQGRKRSIFKALIMSSEDSAPPNDVSEVSTSVEETSRKQSSVAGDIKAKEALGDETMRATQPSVTFDLHPLSGGIETHPRGSPLNRGINEFTFSAASLNPRGLNQAVDGSISQASLQSFKKSPRVTRRPHSAKRLNELLSEHSSKASAVLVNLPALPRSPDSEFYYMDYVETLTEGLHRVILVRGSGREVITAFAE